MSLRTSATPLAIEVDLLLGDRTFLCEGENDRVDTKTQLRLVAESACPSMDIPLVGVDRYEAAIDKDPLQMVR